MNSSDGLYLKSLELQNVATFTNQQVQFDKKFNAIVGETGSGKSLILEAMQLIFGQRAEKKIIRKKSKFATIEAVFHCEDPCIRDYFNQIDYPFEGNEIIVKRVVYNTGSAKSYLNLQSCSLGILTNFAGRFVDLVGQFENQKLLSENYPLLPVSVRRNSLLIM